MKTLIAALAISLSALCAGQGFAIAKPEPYFTAMSPIFGYDPAYGTLIGLAWFSYPTGQDNSATTYKDLNLVTRIGPNGALNYGQRNQQVNGGWGYDIRFGLNNFYEYQTTPGSNEIAQTFNQLSLDSAMKATYQLTEKWSAYAGTINQWTSHEKDGQRTKNYLTSGLILDTRDHQLNSHRGVFVSQSVNLMPRDFCSYCETTSIQFKTDARAFVPLSERHTLALRTLVETANQGGLNSSVGGSELLRGYLAGQHTAPAMLAAQAELRFPIWSFIQGVTFLEAATLIDDKDREELASAGLGFRFGLPPDQSMSVRWDNAVNAHGQWLSYINFNQVF